MPALAVLLEEDPQAPPEAAVQELHGWLTDPPETGRDPMILFPDPGEYTLLVLRDQLVLRARAVEAILDRLPMQFGEAASVTVFNLVVLAFEDHESVRGTAFAALSPLRQRLLRTLVELPALWRDDEDRRLPIWALLSHWWPPGVASARPEELRAHLRAYVAGRQP